MKNWKEINERRANYIAKRNTENMQVESLTEEQHEALQRVCSMRHNFHMNSEDMFNTESSNHDELWNMFDDCNTDSFNSILADADLPTIDFGSVELCLPNNSDWQWNMTASERDEWEQKADEFNKQASSKAFEHTGYSLWVEEGEEHQIFIDEIAKINPIIENYLADIDRTHGTNYCPSGCQRNF